MSDENSNSNLIVPRFFIHTVPNDAKSKAAGRPIFDEMEVCEIRMAANRQTVGVFPAHEVWKIVDTDEGGREPRTYAMRFSEQYKKFKSGEAQAMSGTPLEELPFLTASKRLELKALNIYTAETLAALDGQPLKILGMGGRELKTQAQAYIAKAIGSADVTRFAAENELLKQQMDDLRAQVAALSSKPPAPAVHEETGSPFNAWEDPDIKNWIDEQTGQRPKGNPSHATLVAMADEINAKVAEAA